MIRETDLNNFNLKFLIYIFTSKEYINYPKNEVQFRISCISYFQFLHLVNSITKEIELNNEMIEYLFKVVYTKEKTKTLLPLYYDFSFSEILEKNGQHLKVSDRLLFYLKQWSEISNLFNNQIYNNLNNYNKRADHNLIDLVLNTSQTSFHELDDELCSRVLKFIEEDCISPLMIDIITKLKKKSFLDKDLQIVLPLVFSFESYLNIITYNLIKTKNNNEFQALKSYYINCLNEYEKRTGQNYIHQFQILEDDYDSIWVNDFELYQQGEDSSLTTSGIIEDINDIFSSINQIKDKKYITSLIHNHILIKDKITLKLSSLKFNDILNIFFSKNNVEVTEFYTLNLTKSITTFDKKYLPSFQKRLNKWNKNSNLEIEVFDRKLLNKFIHLLFYLELKEKLSFTGKSSLTRLFIREFKYLNLPKSFNNNFPKQTNLKNHLKRANISSTTILKILSKA